MKTTTTWNLALLIVTALGVTPCVAQSTTELDDAWAPWIGCWTPIEMQAQVRDPRVCVVRGTSAGAVRLVTFSGDVQLDEQTIVADATRHPITERGCSGDRESRWSASRARLFTTGDILCDGQSSQPFSGMSTLTADDRWLDVQAVGPAGREAVRVRQYARSTDTVPAPLAKQLRDRSVSARSRVTRPSIDDVVEASRAVAGSVVEAWIAESALRLAIKRDALLKLSASQVSEPVINVLIGLAYPQRFEIRRPSSGGGFFGAGPFNLGDPFMAEYGPWDFGYGAYGTYASMYSPFGLSVFGSGFYPVPYVGYPYGPDFFGAPLVTPGGSGAVEMPSGRGQVINGQGYTRVEPRAPVVDVNAADGGGSRGLTSSSAGDGGGGSVSTSGYSSGGGGASTASGGGGNFAVPR